MAAKLCSDEAYWPPLPKEGVTYWWGQPDCAMGIIKKGDLSGQAPMAIIELMELPKTRRQSCTQSFVKAQEYNSETSW